MTNLDDTKTLSFPIAELAAALGLQRQRGSRDTYFAPGRDEKTASLKLYPTKQMWRDYGAAQGGGLLDLILYCRPDLNFPSLDKNGNTVSPKARAMMLLKQLAGAPQRQGYTPAPKKGERISQERRLLIENWRPEDRRDITDPQLLEYAAGRNWHPLALHRYCSQLDVAISGTSFKHRLIAFPNLENGFVLRGPGRYGKMSTNQAPSAIAADGTFTTQKTTKGLMVFEGFGNFLAKLSYDILTSNGLADAAPGIDTLVLNSWQNIAKEQARDLLKSHEIILWYGDNDKAGYQAMDKARTMTRAEIIDMIPTFANSFPGNKIDDYNDFLNLWCSQRQRT